MSINDEIKQLLESSKKQESESIVEEITELDSDDVEGISDEQVVSDILALDELSKKTLGSYIKKAASDFGSHKRDSGFASGIGRHRSKEAEEASRKSIKRIKGINKATDKLTKEQKESIESILDELSEEFEEKEITVDVSEDVNALLNGEELTEEFKTKAATIFEAAVVTRVKEEISKLEESYETRLSEEVEQIKEGIADKVDGYLNLVVEQWMTDNEIALTQGIKTEIMENFLSGIKSVFEQNYIEVPEEKFDVLESMESKIAELENKLNEATEKNVELNTKVNGMKKEVTISEACEGLTDTQVEKFKSLIEELSFEDEETFTEKLKTIRENYFTKQSIKKQLRETFITDEAIEEPKEEKFVDPAMSAYLNAMSKSATF